MPNIDMMMTFLTLSAGCPLMASATAVAEADMKRGGEVVAANGFPDVRVWPSVLINTTGPLIVAKAVVISPVSRGEPLDIVREG